MNQPLSTETLNRIFENQVQNRSQSTSESSDRFRRCQFRVVSLKLAYDELTTCLKEFSPGHAWLSYQSRNEAFSDGQFVHQPATDVEYGYLLHGELTKADEDRSLHVHYQANGNWRVSEYFIEGDENGDWLVDQTRVLATSHSLGMLTYNRIWALNTDGSGYAPIAACFDGFSDRDSREES